LSPVEAGFAWRFILAVVLMLGANFVLRTRPGHTLAVSSAEDLVASIMAAAMQLGAFALLYRAAQLAAP